MTTSKPNFQKVPRGSNYSTSGKPARILKIRAKKAPSKSDLTELDSEPAINQISVVNMPPPIELNIKAVDGETEAHSLDLGPPPSLIQSVSDYDLVKTNTQNADSPLAAIKSQLEERTFPINLDKETENVDIHSPEDAMKKELDGLPRPTFMPQETQSQNHSREIEGMALDSGVEMSPLKNIPPGHSSFKGPKEIIASLSKPAANEHLDTFAVSEQIQASSSFGSDLDKATESSSRHSVLAEQSSTASSEEPEPILVPFHRHDISIESELIETLSLTSTTRNISPDPSIRSLTVTPASERVQTATPSDEPNAIADDITLLLYELQNGQICGYNIDLFLDHHAVLKAMYSCPQCKCIIREPHFSEWEACCKICLPKLRTPQKVKQAIFDKHLNKKIQSLPVKCALTGRGCQWRGKLKQLEAHLVRGCSHMRFECPHNGCDEVFYRKNLEKHVNGECGQRKSNCPHCNTEVPVLRFNEHLIYVRCPKDCSETQIPQCLLGLHILKQCGRIMVPCPYNSYGCEDQVPRGEIHEHMITQNGSHLRLLRTLVDDSRSTIEKLVEENENLQSKIESGRRECGFLENNINLPGTLLWKIPKIFHQMKNRHVVESKGLVVEGYRVYALLWFGGWHSPGDVELGIIQDDSDNEKEWPVFFKVRYTIIHPTDSTQGIVAETMAKFDRAQRSEKKEKTWNKAQGFISGFIPIQKQHQLHAFLMDSSLYIKVEIENVNPLPVL